MSKLERLRGAALACVNEQCYLVLEKDFWGTLRKQNPVDLICGTGANLRIAAAMYVVSHAIHRTRSGLQT